MSRGPIPDFSPERPSVPEIAEKIREYYTRPGNSVGGSLHVVLDDGNLQPSHIEYCLKYAVESGDSEGAELARALLQMTPTQRRVLSAMNFYPW